MTALTNIGSRLTKREQVLDECRKEGKRDYASRSPNPYKGVDEAKSVAWAAGYRQAHEESQNNWH